MLRTFLRTSRRRRALGVVGSLLLGEMGSEVVDWCMWRRSHLDRSSSRVDGSGAEYGHESWAELLCVAASVGRECGYCVLR